MPTQKEFSLQSTSIAQNPQSDTSALKLTRVKSQKFLFENSNFVNSSSINPFEMFKTSLKLLELNPFQQQFILTQVQQFQDQNNKNKNPRSKSSLKKTPSIDSKKKPPLPQSNQQPKSKPNLGLKKQLFLNQPTQSKPLTFLEPILMPSQSSIVKKPDEAQKIVKFFPENTVKGFAVMFKASEHNFNLKEFFKSCGPTQNLLIICQTNKSKVIGAFSPLSHDFSGKSGFEDKWGEKVKDPSNQSFIFSLTNNHKFSIKSQEHAIYRWRDRKYLIFGDWQFTLCDGANKNKNCRTDNINLNYFNAEYKNSKESWMRLNGNEDAWFTTNEWQAWKVDFQNGQNQQCFLK